MEQVFIEDKQGNKVLPITHVDAVRDSNGNTISSIMGTFEDEVRGLVDTPHQEYVTVDAYASLPVSGSTDTIYRVSNYDGSQSQVDNSVYSEYAWNGTQYVFLCVKSAVGEVFDISAYHNNAKYTDLTDALTGTNGGVPQSLQKGGMSVKYVRSSDNKYVQYIYVGTSTNVADFTNTINWQGTDEVIKVEQKLGINNILFAKGYYINESGESVYIGGNWSCSDYVELSHVMGSAINLSSNCSGNSTTPKALAYAFYDASKNYIQNSGSLNGATNIPINSTLNASYVRFSFYNKTEIYINNYSEIPTIKELHEEVDNIQDADTTPTENSQKFVTSDGVYQAIKAEDNKWKAEEDVTDYVTFTERKIVDGRTGVMAWVAEEVSPRPEASGFINVENISSIRFTVITAIESSQFWGYAWYSSNNESSFLSGGYINRQLVVENRVIELEIPTGAKFLRTTCFMDEANYGEIVFIKIRSTIPELKEIDRIVYPRLGNIVEVSTKETIWLYNNIADTFTYGGTGFSFTLQDGVIKYKNIANFSGWSYLSFVPTKESVVGNTEYYLVFDIKVVKNILTEGGGSSANNNSFSLKFLPGSDVISNSIVTGQRGLIYARNGADNNNANAAIQLQTKAQGAWEEGDIEIWVYNVAIIPTNECDYNSAIELANAIQEKGFESQTESFFDIEVKTAKEAEHASKSDSVASLDVTKDIDCWGDSLTAQDYGTYVAQLTGRNVYSHGYGGKMSGYIRDQFLLGYNRNRTNIIWVGRNDFGGTQESVDMSEAILDNVRAMVDVLGSDFLILTPPNGHWGTFGTNGENGTGEMKNGTSYQHFLHIAELLKKEFGDNVLDIRESSIIGYTQGVKLLSSFVQPSLNGSVQIEVSDTAALTTYNNADLERFGQEFMSRIAIGLNGKYDIYDVVSVVDETHMTVSLYENNNVSPASTVENLTLGEAINYLRVEQYADYMCRIYDTTLSTFRSDGIHMTESGKQYVARKVVDKLNSMKI